MKQNLIIVLIIFEAFALSAKAPLSFRQWNESKGLPSDQIRTFAPLDDGRMAIIVPNGLITFDGTHFKMHYFDPSRPYPLPETPTYICAAYKGSDGKLWLKHPGMLSLFDPSKGRFECNIDSVLAKDYGIHGPVRDLWIDSESDLWCVTSDGWLMHSSARNAAAAKICLTDGKWRQAHGKIKTVADIDSQFIIATDKGQILTYDKKQHRFTSFDDIFSGQRLDPDRKLKILTDLKGRTWVMHDRLLLIKEKGANEWKKIFELSGNSNFFTSMAIDGMGNVWAGTSWSGLRVIDGESLVAAHYPTLPIESGASLSNDIQDIFIDAKGGVWIGTLWQGVAYHHPKMNPFRTFHTNPDRQGQSSESVRALIEEPNGDILIATTYCGIVRYTPSSGEVRPERRDLFPTDDVYISLYRDASGALWVGSYTRGFTRLHPDGTAEHYNFTPGRTSNISRGVAEDGKGRFWVSVNNEPPALLDISTGKISHAATLQNPKGDRKRDRGIFFPDADRVSVYGEDGILTISTSTGKVEKPAERSAFSAAINSNTNGMLTDTRGLTWIATDHGLIAGDATTEGTEGYAPTMLTESNSLLPSNYVSAIVEDKFGQIWASTSGGLVRIIIRPAGERKWEFDIKPFVYTGTLKAGRLTENAALVASDGTVYFGGYNGVVAFNPSDLSPLHGTSYATPLITSLSIDNRNVEPGEKIDNRVIIEKTVLNGETIRLRHDQNFFSLGFSSLDFTSGKHVQYRYRLKGYDRDWVESGAGLPSLASYTGVPPGKYEFEVTAAGADGVWSEEPGRATIIVEPAIWATWWAKLLYAILIVGGIGIVVRLYLRGKQHRMTLQSERLEAARQDELNQMKFQFFTNISHEFRTPLALIMTPLSHLMKTGDMPDQVRDKLKGIYNNAENLLGQVNRLLDFRKLEMGGERLNVGRCRIVQFTSYLMSSFENITEGKNITLSLDARVPEDTDIYLDSHKLRHILTNLYSNAIKFTPVGGRITTTISKEKADGAEMLRIDVSDTGSGIPEKDLPHIFGRFFQVENRAQNPTGTGIGLHLVSEYVKLHGGKISVESKEGVGTCISILLPTNLTSTPTGGDEGEAGAAAGQLLAEGTEPGKTRLLVVEDNPEFRDFLSEYLSPHYEVATASDGVEALEKAGQKLPDLIVTDLMMPRKDGLELIKDLKENIATSHIPIVLLTAKASDEARIESYKVGADSYISKPFNFEVLLARIARLLKDAHERQEKFRESKTVRDIEPSAVTITSLDEKMVEKALKTVEENMDNSSFSTVQLGEALGLSRSQLYRKFESVTGMSPADFITRMRMKRAAQLLRDSQLNVTEIADMTGFNSTKYFNKHFKEEYGCTPTEYRAQNT